MTKLESQFQSNLKKVLYELFPGCVLIKGNSEFQPGIPDLLILFGNRWALLECKRSATEVHQPNQDWYVEQFDNMSFASFIYPENEEEVLDALQLAFGTQGHAFVPEPEQVPLDQLRRGKTRSNVFEPQGSRARH